MTNGSTDREQERAREMEEEKQRQRKLRDKVAGRRPNGKARAGDIDGKSFQKVPFCVFSSNDMLCSGSGPNQRRVGSSR